MWQEICVKEERQKEYQQELKLQFKDARSDINIYSKKKTITALFC